MTRLSRSNSSMPSEEDLTQVRIEIDRAQRIVREKKQQIHFLELEASKLDELQILMRDALIIIGQKQNIDFFPGNKNNQEIPELKPIEYVNVINDAIKNIVNKHESLSRKFEATLRSEKFKQKQEVESAKTIVQNELEKLRLAQRELDHKIKLVDMVKGQKVMLQRIIMMSQDSVDRRRQRHDETKQECAMKIEKQAQMIDKIKEMSVKNEEEFKEKVKLVEERKKVEEEMIENHKNLVAQKEEIKAKLKALSYDESCLMSDLDKAKEQLNIIKETSDSFFANMKTHELLNAEKENERLRNLLKNEKRGSAEAYENQLARTKQLEVALRKIVEQTREINQQIGDSEQKVQTISMKIPEFNQLKQALAKVRQIAKKNTDEAIQTQYMLDEIRDKNRLIEQQEYNESKMRTEQLLQKLAEPKGDD